MRGRPGALLAFVKMHSEASLLWLCGKICAADQRPLPKSQCELLGKIITLRTKSPTQVSSIKRRGTLRCFIEACWRSTAQVRGWRNGSHTETDDHRLILSPVKNVTVLTGCSPHRASNNQTLASLLHFLMHDQRKFTRKCKNRMFSKVLKLSFRTF